VITCDYANGLVTDFRELIMADEWWSPELEIHQR